MSTVHGEKVATVTSAIYVQHLQMHTLLRGECRNYFENQAISQSLTRKDVTASKFSGYNEPHSDTVTFD